MSAAVDAECDGAGNAGRGHSPEWMDLESDSAAADDDNISKDIPQELIHVHKEDVE